ncbi:MAG: c-type cytochrome [Terracidiphilus sp.]
MARILLGVLLGIVLVPITLLAWLRFGWVPVAVADPPLPYERQLTGMALHARIAREMVKTPPIQADGGNLVAGAEIYRDHCAGCHGFFGKPSQLGSRMFPFAPQLWQQHTDSTAVGVSDDPPGETYWKVANGIRLTGMPSFQGALSSNEMWQVSLLLSRADKPLPPEADAILSGQTAAPPETTSGTAATR